MNGINPAKAFQRAVFGARPYVEAGRLTREHEILSGHVVLRESGAAIGAKRMSIRVVPRSMNFVS